MAKQSEIARQMILKTGSHAGPHKNREYDYNKGHIRKSKYKPKYE